ncbi:DUF1648 domain-containing protein [Parerythrobacter jejuensis]|uniref:DUF1648 domain-containing protein n=1 Tax=Parerythrobacter jejuensis TaxID=795812 RepID=A0A845AL78_9SPHN|nr:DUF1648 domain-containing protein [Parerythrobacter jejuensis]MXP31522.1 DUF1648 domain-containing protein [Parerythrobacter jejuensis]
MPGIFALAVMLLAILALCGSALWTDRHYQRFDQIPAHYDFRGKATRLAPRTTMAWLLPGIMVAMLLGFLILLTVIPAELQNGDPSSGLILMSVIFVLTQGLILWLLHRWARAQA